jgi:hypothetical protein
MAVPSSRLYGNHGLETFPIFHGREGIAAHCDNGSAGLSTDRPRTCASTTFTEVFPSIITERLEGCHGRERLLADLFSAVPSICGISSVVSMKILLILDCSFSLRYQIHPARGNKVSSTDRQLSANLSPSSICRPPSFTSCFFGRPRFFRDTVGSTFPSPC